MTRWYIWENDRAVPVDVLDFTHWSAATRLMPGAELPSNGHVGYATWPDGCCVSTVFLGLNHNWGAGPPTLFETMVFWTDHDLDQSQERYDTLAEAEAGHRRWIVRVLEARQQEAV